MTRTPGNTPLDGEILMPEPVMDADDAAQRENAVKKGFWRTLKRAARQIPFTHDLAAAYYCAIDPEVPFRVRATLLGALAYFVAPIDALPDIILGIGFTDDATVLVGAISMVAAHITAAHRERAKQALAE
ncbi:YkvA family protein [Acuticoccus sp. MNP-M23]|uniref:YkvA family protein n=1 Tax=Acuticoccus sp. MNP-M23 TaxID=3072793 RepID=UPI0028154543|nr:YkvA family protein [Acuticoccus sp. MNP-M23]WMS44074.1 YkvA family protein [Acuticoccus sp. MNP-M23]